MRFAVFGRQLDAGCADVVAHGSALWPVTIAVSTAACKACWAGPVRGELAARVVAVRTGMALRLPTPATSTSCGAAAVMPASFERTLPGRAPQIMPGVPTEIRLAQS